MIKFKFFEKPLGKKEKEYLELFGKEYEELLKNIKE